MASPGDFLVEELASPALVGKAWQWRRWHPERWESPVSFPAWPNLRISFFGVFAQADSSLVNPQSGSSFTHMIKGRAEEPSG